MTPNVIVLISTALSPQPDGLGSSAAFLEDSQGPQAACCLGGFAPIIASVLFPPFQFLSGTHLPARATAWSQLGSWQEVDQTLKWDYEFNFIWGTLNRYGNVKRKQQRMVKHPMASKSRERLHFPITAVALEEEYSPAVPWQGRGWGIKL
jgi:hypothetical protein